MDLDLAGRRVLVTGGSKGIGLACAESFAAEGAELLLAARDPEALERAASSIGASVAETIAVDLSSEDDQWRLIERCGDIDVLVNNAGAIPPGGITQIDSDTWRSAWDLKVFGYINLCRGFLPAFEQRGSGVIVNVIGAAAVRPQPTYIAGGAGNAALVALTQALGSRSTRHGVRVVGVNPGLVVTDRMKDLLRASAEKKHGDPDRWEEFVPADPRPGTPEQVADVVVFLASDRASHVSGCVVPVDAGGSAR